MSILGDDYYEFEVIEQYMEYPLVIYEYINGNLDYKIYYHYNIIDDIPEVPSRPHEIMSVDYYDITGRKIPKPTNGFYIMSETTDKGIINTKHYIR